MVNVQQFRSLPAGRIINNLFLKIDAASDGVGAAAAGVVALEGGFAEVGVAKTGMVTGVAVDIGAAVGAIAMAFVAVIVSDTTRPVVTLFTTGVDKVDAIVILISKDEAAATESSEAVEVVTDVTKDLGTRVSAASLAN